MFELPEYVVLARQMNETLKGKVILRGQLGNSPHKFVWYNRTHQEFAELTRGKTIGEATARGRWLFVPIEPGYVLVLGECGGKVLHHPPGAKLPKKYHLHIVFEDESFLTATTQMWGAFELYEKGAEQERQYVKDMATTPVTTIKTQSKGTEGARKNNSRPSQLNGVPGITGNTLPTIPAIISKKPVIRQSRSIISAD